MTKTTERTKTYGQDQLPTLWGPDQMNMWDSSFTTLNRDLATGGRFPVQGCAGPAGAACFCVFYFFETLLPAFQFYSSLSKVQYMSHKEHIYFEWKAQSQGRRKHVCFSELTGNCLGWGQATKWQFLELHAKCLEATASLGGTRPNWILRLQTVNEGDGKRVT